VLPESNGPIAWCTRPPATHADYRGMAPPCRPSISGAETVIAANVGDSPIYLIVTTLSIYYPCRHTDSGGLRPTKRSRHSWATSSTRCGRSKDTVDADICELNGLQGDVWSSAPDGLSTKVPPWKSSSIATSRPPDEACARLVDLANARGGDRQHLRRPPAGHRSEARVRTPFFGKWRAGCGGDWQPSCHLIH